MQVQIDSEQNLDCRRRANAKEEDEAGRPGNGLGQYCQKGASYERSRLKYGTANNTGVGDRADRTLMTGELGVLGMNVDSLGKAGEGHQQHAGQKQ